MAVNQSRNANTSAERSVAALQQYKDNIQRSFDKNKEKGGKLIVTNQSEYNGVMLPTRMLYVSPSRMAATDSLDNQPGKETSTPPRGASTFHSRH